jgi:hypothetical protein
MSKQLFLGEVRRFELCEYRLEEFGHGEHLKVAWTYLQLYGYDIALDRMRGGLKRFSAHHNKTGYNETITAFWMRKLQQRCAVDLKAIPKEMLFLHYTRDRVMSDEAKRQWIEPDLLPM